MNNITSTFALVVLLLQALVGCDGSASQTAAVTQVNASFPIVELTYSDRVENVNLRADYGYIIDWPSEKEPTCYVFNKPQRKRIRTSTWEEFIAELRKIPDGSEIDAVSKCMVPFEWGMPDDKRQELSRVLSEKSVKTINVGDQHIDFCSCESTRMVVLSDAAR